MVILRKKIIWIFITWKSESKIRQYEYQSNELVIIILCSSLAIKIITSLLRKISNIYSKLVLRSNIELVQRQ
ncbi:hypothetical protein FGO68_gene1706 [Halteria grandinella]|uniref:Uncharacterized protein n=1 Tax=Halteria grandinella TaxID=5974 RepID=A0A8J8NHZ8_HALGN|nr:hypothetical protein FGO68_gene1706 [Halteria grandinella]